MLKSVKETKRDHEEIKGVQNIPSRICREPSLWWEKRVPKIKVVKNVLKHTLVLKFLKSDEILKIQKFCNCPWTTRQIDGQEQVALSIIQGSSVKDFAPDNSTAWSVTKRNRRYPVNLFECDP